MKPKLTILLFNMLALSISVSPTVYAKSVVIINPNEFQQSPNGKPLELNVQMKKSTIFNPSLKKIDEVELRQYLDGSSQNTENNSLVGPTIRIQPGASLKVLLNNKLDNDECKKQDDHNTPHCFNNTNLHTHGLAVNPGYFKKPDPKDTGIASDNVFINIKPNTSQPFQFEIPKNHPAGTFWYHPHLHGSTALQVSSGMAGTLIVEGNRFPKFENNNIVQVGDIDILLKDTDEKILMFQQIQYNENGKIDDYNELKDPSSWAKSSRYTSINGLVLGKLEMTQNKFSRWRMIHGGIRDTLGLIIKELPNSADFSDDKVIQQCREYGEFIDNKENKDIEKITRFNQLKSINFNTFAHDGITMAETQPTKLSVLQPGYRQDALISFPTVNKYCVFDTKLNDKNEINKNISNKLTAQLSENHELYAKLISWVDVKKSTEREINIQAYLANQAKLKKLPTQIINQIAKNDLSAFAPYKSLENEQVKNDKQELNFNINTSSKPTFEISNKINDDKNSKAYTGKQEDVRYLNFKTTDESSYIDEWNLTSTLGGHPFHIHVNPFQIQKILNEKNEDVSGNPSNGGQYDVQFNNLKHVWKDTIFVPKGYTVITRTQYDNNLLGDFVLHCHILDHEDQGMMQDVRICDPNESLEMCKARPFAGDTPKIQHSHH